MRYPEKLLMMIWQCRMYNVKALRCETGEYLHVISPGSVNRDAGPDFLQAKIQMDGIAWFGHVEIHWDAADWCVHGHQSDVSYDSVILHVVWQGDEIIKRTDGTIIPSLQLQKIVDPQILPHYQQLMESLTWIPCASRLPDVPNHISRQVLDRLLPDRLMEKVEMVFKMLSDYQGDWERTVRVWMAQTFGMRVNKHAFLRLLESFPNALIDRYKHRKTSLEALLFGQSGLLPSTPTDSYTQCLRSEYNYLKKLHQLTPMDAQEWKFLRMRPSNFPTIRIAQLAVLFHYTPNLCSLIVEAENFKNVEVVFSKVEVSGYWTNRVRFGKIGNINSKFFSTNFMYHLIINSFVVIAYAYGRYHGTEALQDRAVTWLEKLPPENNNLVRKFSKHGLDVLHAGDTQALLHLHARYCSSKQCMSCSIGYFVMNNRGN